VGTTTRQLPDDVAAGDVLVLGDGLIVLEVTAVAGTAVACPCSPAACSSGKGLNKRGGGLSAAALTDKDRATSPSPAPRSAWTTSPSRFRASAADMHEARALIGEATAPRCGLVAKLERAEAVADPAPSTPSSSPRRR
jgi:pyruvate kinase